MGPFFKTNPHTGAHNSPRDKLQAAHHLGTLYLYYPFCEVKKINHTLKKTLVKLCQETYKPGPTCFLRHPSGSSSLNWVLQDLAIEMNYERPFLTIDVLLDEYMDKSLRSIINLEQVQKTIQGYAHKHCQLLLKIQRK